MTKAFWKFNLKSSLEWKHSRSHAKQFPFVKIYWLCRAIAFAHEVFSFEIISGSIDSRALSFPLRHFSSRLRTVILVFFLYRSLSRLKRSGRGLCAQAFAPSIRSHWGRLRLLEKYRGEVVAMHRHAKKKGTHTSTGSKPRPSLNITRIKFCCLESNIDVRSIEERSNSRPFCNQVLHPTWSIFGCKLVF